MNLNRFALTLILFLFPCVQTQAALEGDALEKRLLLMEKRLAALEHLLAERETEIAAQESKIEALQTKVVAKQKAEMPGLTATEKESLATLARLEPILYEAEERIGYHYGRPGLRDDASPLAAEDLRLPPLPAWAPAARLGSANAIC